MANVTANLAQDLSFKALSVRTFYAAFIIGMSALALGCGSRHVMKMGINLGGLSMIIFYLSTMTSAVLFFRLARHWRSVMMRYAQVERIFSHNPTDYPTTGISLKRKIRTVAVVVLVAGLVEHSFYIMAKMVNVVSQIEKCNFNVHFYEHFIRTERRHLYSVFPFHFAIAVPFEWVNASNTITWTFIDLFIMLVSISLAYRYQQIADRITRIQLQSMPNAFWTEIRLHYTSLTELVTFMDTQLANFVLLSCATDVAFTCYLLFFSFGEIADSTNAVYFYFSIIFIISRTLSTLFFAATINDCASKPYHLLRNIPYAGYGTEVERFEHQLRKESVTLTGRGLFGITRIMILSVGYGGRLAMEPLSDGLY